MPAKGLPQGGTEGASAGPAGNTSGIEPPHEDFSSDGETLLSGDEEVLAGAAATVIGFPIAPA